MYQAKENRYSEMPYVKCGNSGLKLPKISLGLWHNFGSVFPYENMKQLIFTAFDNGITHFDLANNYGPVYGSAETNFGRILREELGTYRDELIITTKAGYDMWPGPYGDHGSRKYLLASLDQSLKRMGLDYVDIFYHHRPDPETPLEDYDGERMSKASRILEDLRVPFIVNQNRYNIFDRGIENNGLKQAAAELGKGIVAFCPLAQGLLTDRYLNGIPEDSRIRTDGRFLKESAVTEEKLSQIRALNEITKEENTPNPYKSYSMEGILLDLMYEIPDMKDVTEVVINEKVVLGEGKPVLVPVSDRREEITVAAADFAAIDKEEKTNE